MSWRCHWSPRFDCLPDVGRRPPHDRPTIRRHCYPPASPRRHQPDRPLAYSRTRSSGHRGQGSPRAEVGLSRQARLVLRDRVLLPPQPQGRSPFLERSRCPEHPWLPETGARLPRVDRPCGGHVGAGHRNRNTPTRGAPALPRISGILRDPGPDGSGAVRMGFALFGHPRSSARSRRVVPGSPCPDGDVVGGALERTGGS